MSIKTALFGATLGLALTGTAASAAVCACQHRVVHQHHHSIHRTSYVHTRVINRTVVVNRTVYVNRTVENPPVEVADEDQTYYEAPPAPVYYEDGGAYSYRFGAYAGPRGFYGREHGGAYRYGPDGQYGQWHSDGAHSWREGMGHHEGGWHR